MDDASRGFEGVGVRKSLVAAIGLVLLGLAGCAPEVGSEAWCEKMDQTPKGDWSANQAADYAKHCILR